MSLFWGGGCQRMLRACLIALITSDYADTCNTSNNVERVEGRGLGPVCSWKR